MKPLGRLTRTLRKPARFIYLDPYLQGPVRVLDLGCANGSPQATKRYYPHIRYDGVTLARSDLDEADWQAADRILVSDIRHTEVLAQADDGAYDVIIASHILEHLEDIGPILERLWQMLRPGGILYIETPTPRSLRLPSMRGTLNFHDDPTHVRVWTRPDLEQSLGPGAKILRGGTRRIARRIVLLPAYVLWRFAKGLAPAPAYWDLLGFSWYLIARKDG